MTISIAPNFTQRNCTWTEMKVFKNVKNFALQSLETEGDYTIWAYDGPEAFICKIYKTRVPQYIIDAGAVTQSQNDNDKLDFETKHKATCNKKIGSIDITSMPAFASKMIGDKKLYKRVQGIQKDVFIGTNTISWTNPYPWVKFMEIQFTNCETGDYVDLEVYDTATGTYSTVPNYKLNQFGFTANLCKDFYEHKSEFDADLYFGMIVRITYYSITIKKIGINFVMNEVKS